MAQNMINLLPWRTWQHQTRLKYIMYRVSLYALFLIILVYPIHYYFKEKTHKFNNAIKRAQQSMREIARHGVSDNNDKLLHSLTTLFSIKSTIAAKNKRLIQVFCHLATDLPTRMTLTTLDLTGQQLILSGVSDQVADITRYQTRLTKNTGIPVVLTDIHSDSKEITHHFTFRMSV